jgi:hypothetical protein
MFRFLPSLSLSSALLVAGLALVERPASVAADEIAHESEPPIGSATAAAADEPSRPMTRAEFLAWVDAICSDTGCPTSAMSSAPQSAAAEAPDRSAEVVQAGGSACPSATECPDSQTIGGAENLGRSEMANYFEFSDAAAAAHSVHDAGTGSEFNEAQQLAVDMAHAAVYQHDPFPSAKKCAVCHPGHFREWSVSPHAYAQLSPVFNAMSSRINQLANGTLGDFCIRCHTPIGMLLGEPIVMSNIDRYPSSREGVTCCVCHRINQAFGKGSGRQALVAADLDGPVYGTLGGEILSDVLANPEKYGVMKTDAESSERGRTVHAVAVPFFQLHTAGFCGACHDVFAPNGFRLEDAFSEYKSSPAAREKQQSCQDCHMGEVPGVAAGYRIESIAKLGNAYSRPRKRTNHMMAGPDYSVIHPGLFPHNIEAVKEEHDAYVHAGTTIPGLATMREWLEFDHHSEWGQEAFENSDAAQQLNETGPVAWRDPVRRYQARRIITDQLELLTEYTEARRRVMSNGFELGEIQCDSGLGDGLRFRVLVDNKTDGHGVPTGFDAERVIFLRVLVWDANGKIVFVSGDLDPNGDIRDSHSVYVHNGKLPLDPQLFTLQTRFVTRNIRGGEREQVLALPFSLDPLPYVRPETRPFTVLGRPLGARKHKQNLAAKDGFRWARYHVDQSQLTGCGPYSVHVQLIQGMVPVNLVHEIESVGFDYDMSPREVAKRVVEGHIVIQQRQAVIHK